MDDRLNKPLSEIVSDAERNRGRGRGRLRVPKGGNGSRGREQRNTTDNRRPSRGTSSDRVTYECAIKFLLDNNLAGSLIGNQGCAIRDLIEITDASIHISNNTRRHPTAGDRTLFISGAESAVSLASALVWEMIGQQTDAENEGLRDLFWNPATAKAAPGQYDNVQVHCQLTIPAASAGRVIGRGGNTFRNLQSESGATASIDSVEDADLLQERIISVSGTAGACMKFTSMLLSKLMEAEDGCQYVYSGSAYPMSLASGAGEAGERRGRSSGGRHGEGKRAISPDESTGRQNNRRVSSRTDMRSSAALHDITSAAETLSATTTIELAVPNAYVGAILGVQGAKLHEIVSLSGAKVRVSPRGEYVEGTNNRIVTIEGSPMSAQTAHTLIVHKVRQEMAEKSD